MIEKIFKKQKHVEMKLNVGNLQEEKETKKSKSLDAKAS